MQHLNDGMDELFRKAANDYSLLHGEEDFDTIAARLANATTTPLTMAVKKPGKNKLAFLFIALPLLLISGAIVLFYPINSKTYNNNVGLKPTGDVTNSTNNKYNTRNIRSIYNLMTASVTDGKISSLQFLRDIQLSKAKTNILLAAGSKPNKTLFQDDFSAPMIYKAAKEEKYYRVKVSNRALIDPTNVIAQDKGSNLSLITFNKIKGDTSKQVIVNKNQDAFTEKNKRFYIAIVAGPQWNQVKGQGYGIPGISGGLFAGMHLNKRISIETGLLISEKKYFSSGAYFSMSKLETTMPAGMKLISMDGKSTVLEIPVALKYDVIKKTKSCMFVSAGVSSFILTKESNKYLALVNNSQQNLTGNYSTCEKYFIGALNISAGYEYKTGNGIAVRVEPYVQLPVKGTGVGSIHLSSAGVRLGVSFPLTK